MVSSYFCQECNVEFESRLPDGSCPECYLPKYVQERRKPDLPSGNDGSGAAERVAAQPGEPPPQQASQQHPVLHVPFPAGTGGPVPTVQQQQSPSMLPHGGAFGQHGQSYSTLNLQPVQNGMRMPVRVDAAVVANRPVAGNMPIQTQPINMNGTGLPSVFQIPAPVPLNGQNVSPGSLSMGGQNVSAGNLSMGLPRALAQGFAPPGFLPRMGIGPAPGVIPGSGAYSQAALPGYPAGYPGLQLAGMKLSEDPQQQQRMQQAKLLGNSPLTHLFLMINGAKGPALSRVDECIANQSLGVELPFLQYTIEALEDLKTVAEARLRSHGINASIYELTYGRKRAESVLSCADSDGTADSSTASVSGVSVNGFGSCTVIVKHLPKDTTERDLFEYFARVCRSRADVRMITVAKLSDRRTCRGHAYVEFTGNEVARRICMAKNHVIRGNAAVVEQCHSKDDLRKRNTPAHLYVSGLSFIPDEAAFIRLVTQTYGPLKQCYFNPGPRAFANVVFMDPQIEKKLLADGHLRLNNKRCNCRAWMAPKEIAMRKQGLEYKEPKTPDDGSGLETADTESVVSEIAEERRKITKTATDRDCVICLEMEIAVTLKPCNHACLCEGCVAEAKGECPLCRGPIESHERVYLP